MLWLIAFIVTLFFGTLVNAFGEAIPISPGTNSLEKGPIYREKGYSHYESAYCLSAHDLMTHSTIIRDIVDIQFVPAREKFFLMAGGDYPPVPIRVLLETYFKDREILCMQFVNGPSNIRLLIFSTYKR